MIHSAAVLQAAVNSLTVIHATHYPALPAETAATPAARAQAMLGRVEISAAGRARLAAEHGLSSEPAADRGAAAAVAVAGMRGMSHTPYAVAEISNQRTPPESVANQRRLDEIRSTPALMRSSEDSAFMLEHDTRLKEIVAKDSRTLTSDELDYLQKATGFVNTMAELTTQEKALYDELVTAGNWPAVAGLHAVALARSGLSGQQVTLPDGRSFDPRTTQITPQSLRELFSQMFVDTSGQMQRQLEALAQALEQRSQAA